MKKISLLMFTFFLAFASFAQDAKFGLKAGLNVATLSNSQGSEFNTKLGLHAGLLAHIHLAPSWALQPEIMYSSQGAKYTTLSGVEHELGLNYINIPLQVQYMFNNGFRIQTGPQLGILASVKDKQNDVETGNFTSDDFKSVDIAWSAGLGYLTYSGFGIDARYNFGLNNINDVGTNNLKNNVFQVGLFYMLNNNHKAQSR
ncbi:MAG: porin family protein [Flavisolibacter sp.]